MASEAKKTDIYVGRKKREFEIEQKNKNTYYCLYLKYTLAIGKLCTVVALKTKIIYTLKNMKSSKSIFSCLKKNTFCAKSQFSHFLDNLWPSISILTN